MFRWKAKKFKNHLNETKQTETYIEMIVPYKVLGNGATYMCLL